MRSALLLHRWLLDIRNIAGDSFGSENLRKLVKRKMKDIDGLIKNVVSALENFSKEAIQYDDITILSLLRK